jgi:hypothetical protein
MAFLSRLRSPGAQSLEELETKLNQDAFVKLRPSAGRSSPHSRDFEQITVEPVERGQGWKRIEDLPPLFHGRAVLC